MSYELLTEDLVRIALEGCPDDTLIPVVRVAVQCVPEEYAPAYRLRDGANRLIEKANALLLAARHMEVIEDSMHNIPPSPTRLYRRATHANGKARTDFTPEEKAVFDVWGEIVHLCDSNLPMTLEQLAAQAARYCRNFPDSRLLSVGELEVGLNELVQARMVEIVDHR